MKQQKWFTALAVVTALFLSAGCASSERMKRLSGGVVADYSAPQKHRLRSEKYQKLSAQSLDARYSMPKPTRSGDRPVPIPELQLNDNLINLWPFFFRSGLYTSMFWPVMDWDPYGFAFRPFYNHEGDDYSILFPLSAWNTATKDGWCLLCIWDKDGWCVFPFAVWHPQWGYLVLPLAYKSGDAKNGTCMITPFFWHSWRYGSPNWQNPAIDKEDNFWLCTLAYSDKCISKDMRQWYWLFSHYGWNTQQQQILAYKLSNTPYAAPKNQQELDELKKTIFDQLPDQFCLKYGLFPFFHVNQEPDSKSLYILGPAARFKTKDNGSKTVSILGWLIAHYSKFVRTGSEYYDLYNHIKESSSFTSIPLLSHFSTEILLDDHIDIARLREIYSLNSNEHQYKQNLVKTMELWKAIDPKLELPKTVCSAETMKLFVCDYAKTIKRTTYTEKSGGCLPLFLFSSNPRRNWWVLPLLLTGGGGSEEHHSSSFWSVPLLFSVFKHSSSKSLSTVGGPLLWYSKTTRNNSLYRTVFAPTQYAPKSESSLCEMTDTYAALGLYYHGKNSFLIPKEGYSHTDIEQARLNLLSITEKYNRLQREEANYQNRQERCSLMPLKTKIQQYEQLIEIERIKEDLPRMEKLRKNYSDSLQSLRESLDKLGLAYTEEDLRSEPKCALLVREIYDKFTTTRSYEDYGSLFWHKEKYENGNGYWRVLFGLASGQKNGNSEQTQILQFLYRNTRTGSRSEKLIFPFISVQKDGANTRRSFLWRLWQLNETDGKTSGYFFFIPFGK